MKKIHWGILSTAKIGLEKVIPAMQQGKHCEMAAIASRTHKRAREAAKHHKIPKAYGSYQELLEDTSIDAVYIPLPNHMHVIGQRYVHCIYAGIFQQFLIRTVCFGNLVMFCGFAGPFMSS